MFNKLLLASVLAAGVGISATPAFAYIACNREGGDCWHSDARVHVPGVTFEYHPDDWYFHRHWDSDRDHHWRESHEGRGYYKGGVWVTL